VKDAARASRARTPGDPEEELACVLLVQACEENDPERRFVPQRERDAAAREARATLGDGSHLPADPRRFVVARAERIAESLLRRHPSLRTALSAVRLRLPGVPVVVITALVGLTADALGAERRINLLAFPLLTLLAWNALVYLLLLLAPLLARREHGTGLARAAARFATWLSERRLARVVPEQARWLSASWRRFGALWTARAGPLLAARMRRVLHLGALGFAVGIVAGMYVRGLAFEYRASWESTFLDARAVSRLLRVVLGPAAHLTDALRPGAEPGARELLREESLVHLRAPAGDGPAAPWIHLWALTAGAGIVVPRALLAWHEGRRARRLAERLLPPLDDPYFLHLLAPDRGAGVRVDVHPYSHVLSAASRDALLELLHEVFGNRARIEVAEPLAYGAEPPGSLPDGAGPRARVVVFNLAQPPEEEVHGAFLSALRARNEADPRAGSLLVLLDEVPYRARLGDSDDHDRLGQRWRAWERVGRSADLRLAALRTLDADADQTLAAARAALASPLPGAAA
jgi:hypothetical protein